MQVLEMHAQLNLNTFVLPKAVVPIITMTEPISGIELDMSLRSADDKLKLFREYLAIDPRVVPYLKAIKDWAKAREIADSIAGYINSFGYACMGLAALQILDPPLLPNLQNEKGKIKSSEQFLNFGQANTMNLGDLLLHFFRTMATFDYENLRISILHSPPFLAKEAHLFRHTTLICVEDPLEPFLNFSRHVTPETKQKILAEFARARDLLEAGALLSRILEKH